MKASTKYVTFNGVVFDTPEAAENYEVKVRLQAKKNILCRQVSELMRTKVELTRKIIYFEDELRKINNKINSCVLSNDIEQVKLMANRISYRFELKKIKSHLKSIKPLLIKTNKEYCKTEHTLKQYEGYNCGHV